MFEEIILSIIQAATEFLPISSSGHLALTSNLISEPNLFLITVLHLASLFAVVIFTRKEIKKILKFDQNSINWLVFLTLATIPAVIFGLFFRKLIINSFNSLLGVGIGFIFTGIVLLSTKFSKQTGKLNWKNSITIGLFQMLALFPGISRSGMTISSGMFSGIKKETAIKFSFLLFIPLSLGAMILEMGEFYFSFELVISFILCFILSLFFLNLLYLISRKGYFWIFSIYCFIIGIISVILHFS